MRLKHLMIIIWGWSSFCCQIVITRFQSVKFIKKSTFATVLTRSLVHAFFYLFDDPGTSPFHKNLSLFFFFPSTLSMRCSSEDDTELFRGSRFFQQLLPHQIYHVVIPRHIWFYVQDTTHFFKRSFKISVKVLLLSS